MIDDSIPARDAAFARSLAIGTTQMRGSLDFAIDHWASKPGAIQPQVRDALRMSTYEILFMSTPHEVAVDQGVEAVRSVVSRATGLANAVLRRTSESSDEFPWNVSDEPRRTALLTGHPEWLVRMLFSDLGAEVGGAVLAANNTPPPLFVAANPALTDDEGLEYALNSLEAAPAPYGPAGCFRVGNPAPAIASDLLVQHKAFVSDASSQTIAQMCVARPEMRCIEIGAGRGTKTLLLLAHAERLSAKLELTSVDSDARKLDELARRTVKAGFDQPETVAVDASTDALLEAVAPADVVLVDAPCSGLGTLRRHPEKRWDLTPETIAALVALQSSMLDRAAELVRPGGFVVYSTCTLLAAENDTVVDAFLGSDKGSAFTDALEPERVPEEFMKWITAGGRLQTLPTEAGPDGHFAAVLERSV